MKKPKGPAHKQWFCRSEFGRIVLPTEVIINPEVSDAKSKSRGLEGLFERAQISRQTRLLNLMERKSTRRVEDGEAYPQQEKKLTFALRIEYQPTLRAFNLIPGQPIYFRPG